MKEIKRFKKITLANITAAIYGLVGFFIALGVAIFAMANIIMQKDFVGSIIVVTLFNIGTGLLLGIIVALFTAVIGWIVGYITAGVYNMFAKRFGGVVFELDDVQEKEKVEEREEHDEQERE